jgi:hypothetical protein
MEVVHDKMNYISSSEEEHNMNRLNRPPKVFYDLMMYSSPHKITCDASSTANILGATRLR